MKMAGCSVYEVVQGGVLLCGKMFIPADGRIDGC